MTKRRTYTPEFKREAVRLLALGEKKAADLARELDISRNKLYKWRDQLQGKDADAAFPGSGRRAGPEAQLALLKRENERLREENDILKKAARYFARESS
jgi:transposase-like protein